MLTNDLVVALEAIAGKENVSTEQDQLSAYFESDVKPELVLVTPTEVEQIQELVKFANVHKAPVYTVQDKYCPEDIAVLTCPYKKPR